MDRAARAPASSLSVGFRPTWLEPDRTWRLAAIVALAMADAAEAVRRAAEPRDPPEVAERPRRRGPRREPCRKLAGLLGETVGLGGDDPRAIVGIGVNADWAGGRLPARARRRG